jgi:hypothetical protein
LPDHEGPIYEDEDSRDTFDGENPDPRRSEPRENHDGRRSDPRDQPINPKKDLRNPKSNKGDSSTRNSPGDPIICIKKPLPAYEGPIYDDEDLTLVGDVERNNPPQDTVYSSGYDDENGSEDYEIHYPESEEMLENKPDRTNASKTVNYPKNNHSRGNRGNRNDDLPSDLATTQKDSFNYDGLVDQPGKLDRKKDRLMQSDVRGTKDPSLGAGQGGKMGNSMAYPVEDRPDRRKTDGTNTDGKKKPAGSIEEKFEGSIGPSGSDENYDYDYDGPRAQTFKNRVMKDSKGPADGRGGVGRGSRDGGRPGDHASRDSMLSKPNRDRHCDRDAEPADHNPGRSTINSGDPKDKRRPSNTKNLRPA